MDKQKQQEMQEELNADEIREKSNETDEGAMDCWIGSNYEDLISDFIDDYNSEWVNYCREKWREENL